MRNSGPSGCRHGGPHRPDARMRTFRTTAMDPRADGSPCPGQAGAQTKLTGGGSLTKVRHEAKRHSHTQPSLPNNRWRLPVKAAVRVSRLAAKFPQRYQRRLAERETFSTQIIEMALAHTIRNKAEAAYLRKDGLAKRRELMDVWSVTFSLVAPYKGHIAIPWPPDRVA